MMKMRDEYLSQFKQLDANAREQEAQIKALEREHFQRMQLIDFDLEREMNEMKSKSHDDVLKLR
jgi:hypothetical protein